MFRNLTIALVALLTSATGLAQQRVDVFADPQNLKVLPKDIDSAELNRTMRGFAMGLGVRCESCHVGEGGQPLSTFDFASDEKPMKAKARLMMEMVEDINTRRLSRLEAIESSERIEVRCVTCHRGRPRPEMIEDVLDQELADGGVDAAVATYQSLRDTYYGSHSFDFSEFVLPMYAQGLFGKGMPEAAIALAEINAQHYPKSDYTQFTLGELFAAAGDRDAAIRHYRRAVELKPSNERFIAPRLEALQQK